MAGRLAGKKCFLTAAAQGIGRATALRFAAEGAEVIATDLNGELVSELNSVEGITASRLDVMDHDAVRARAAEVGAVDVLFNCAGFVHHGSILEPQVDAPHDLSFTSGVLIHINPEALPSVYDNLYAASGRYIALSEYYNPAPVAIPYRGHEDRLFKRDFAGDLRDRFPDVKLVDYGFCYHRDPNFPADDMTWFLLEKRG